ncbi:MAG: succinylglutamate desuccinylase/aspartoacylase family protein [Gammaproteobacteria bacterium]|nr:succinylglutamate desuccinylase/aspartoacylase family protein [Gammaproteobacteria bacterium]
MTTAGTKQASITIGGTTVEPGERAVIDLPVADLYTHTSLHMPVQVINGRRPGPTLFVSAAIHGDELNGVEIIRRLLQQKIVSQLRGCLIAVPVVNVHGFLDQSRYLPDRRDLNRSFPGSAKGSVAARLAHKFSEQILQAADYGIDMHTGAVHRSNLPQIRANLDDPETLRMAEAFNVPVMLNAALRDGSLRGHAGELGVPTLLYEAGEALRFDEVGIRAGLRGVTSVMRELGMLPRKKQSVSKTEPLIAKSSTWVRAPLSGVVRMRARLGQRVKKDDVLAAISDPFGETETVLYASFAGIVIGRSNLPLAHEGDALFHIARFDSVSRAEGSVEEFRTELHPDTAPVQR